MFTKTTADQADKKTSNYSLYAQDYYQKNKTYLDNLPVFKNFSEAIDFIRAEQSKGNFMYKNSHLKPLSLVSVLQILSLPNKLKNVNESARWGAAIERYEKEKNYFDALPELKSVKEMLHLIINEQKAGNLKFLDNSQQDLSIAYLGQILYLAKKINKPLLHRCGHINYFQHNKELFLEKILRAHHQLKNNGKMLKNENEKEYFYKIDLKKLININSFKLLTDNSNNISPEYFKKAFFVAWVYWRDLIKRLEEL